MGEISFMCWNFDFKYKVLTDHPSNLLFMSKKLHPRHMKSIDMTFALENPFEDKLAKSEN